MLTVDEAVVLRRAIVIAVLVLAASVAQPQPQVLDLPQAITYALEHNYQILAAVRQVDSSVFSVSEAEAEFRLRLQPDLISGVLNGRSTVGYGLTASKKLAWGTEFVTRAHRIEGDLADPSEPQLPRLEVELRQPIFRRFGPLVHRNPTVQAESSSTAVRRHYEQLRIDVVLRTVETYEIIQQLKRQVRADESSLVRTNGLYRVTEAKEIVGRTTRIDTLRVDLLRGQVQSRLELARERLAAQEGEFSELLGYPPETVFELEPTVDLEIKPPSAREAVAIALDHRLDHAQALHDFRDLSRETRIASRSLLPDLSLVARAQNLEESSEVLGKVGETTYFLGLSLGTDFNLAQARAAAGRSEEDQAAALERIHISRLAIARGVQQALSALRRAGEEARIARSNAKLADARLKIARSLFELGRADNFSVTDAEEAFSVAEIQLHASQAEKSLAGYRLLGEMGTLIDVPEELKPPAQEVPY